MLQCSKPHAKQLNPESFNSLPAKFQKITHILIAFCNSLANSFFSASHISFPLLNFVAKILFALCAILNRMNFGNSRER